MPETTLETTTETADIAKPTPPAWLALLSEDGAELFIDHIRGRARLKTLRGHRRINYEEATSLLAHQDIDPDRLLQFFAPSEVPYQPSLEESAAFTEITPEAARAMLACNTRNRPLSKDQVRRYARLMRQGRFLPTCDAIAFDRQGRLANGQHRLQALLNTGAPQLMLVTTGLAPEVFTFLDYGKRRSASDALSIQGFEHPSRLAPLCRLLYNWRRGRLANAHYAGDAENDALLALAERFPDLAASITFCLPLRKAVSGMVPLAFLAFIHWAFSRGGKAGEIETFIKRLATGEGFSGEADTAGGSLATGDGRARSPADRPISLDPVRQLRARLQANRDGPARLYDYKVLSLVITAANYHIKGERKQLKLYTGAAFPEPAVKNPFID